MTRRRGLRPVLNPVDDDQVELPAVGEGGAFSALPELALAGPGVLIEAIALLRRGRGRPGAADEPAEHAEAV